MPAQHLLQHQYHMRWVALHLHPKLCPALQQLAVSIAQMWPTVTCCTFHGLCVSTSEPCKNVCYVGVVWATGTMYKIGLHNGATWQIR